MPVPKKLLQKKTHMVVGKHLDPCKTKTMVYHKITVRRPFLTILISISTTENFLCRWKGQEKVEFDGKGPFPIVTGGNMRTSVVSS